MLFISPEIPFSSQDIYVLVTNFCSCTKNGSIRKIRLISNSITSQSGKQTIAIHILSNMARSKNNQAIKFGQLIECNMRIIFVEKSFRKCTEGTIPLSLSKNQN